MSREPTWWVAAWSAWFRTGASSDEIAVPEGLSFVTCPRGGADGRTMAMAAAPGFDEEARRNADDAVLLSTRVPDPRGGLP